MAGEQDLEKGCRDIHNMVDQGSYYLTWEDLTVVAPPAFVGTGPTRRIIHTVSGFAEPGRLLAIMGPSGSGKSTLLDALAGRVSGNVVMTGEVLLNGKKTRLDYGVAAYVRQQDTMLGTLTVRETIAYSATLRLPFTMSQEEITATVNSAIADMGLEDCADRLIGNWHLRGISGGEKRRLSIALEILTRPRLLFLDEPTTGLDGAAAFFVSQILKNLARHGQTIVSSIHQPSSEVFALFDDLILLAGGETVFFGEAKLAVEFFNDSGVPCPSRRNPSDHFLRCVNSDFDQVTATLKWPVESMLNMSTAEIKAMLVYKYKSSNYAKKATSRIHEVTQNMKGNSIIMLKGSEARWGKQLWTLTKRSTVNMSRDFGYYWLRIAVYIAVSICVGTVFFNIGNSYTALLARGSCGGFLSGFMIMMSIGGFPSFIEEMKIFYKERMNGHYGVGVFILSNFLSSIPFLFLMSISTASITYNLVKFRNGFGHFVFSCLNLLCSIAVVESCMMVVASLVPNFLMGLIVGAGLIGIMMLTAGFFRFYPQIPKPFWRYPVSYINYMAWGLQGATSVVAHCMGLVWFIRGFWRAILAYGSEHGYVHGLNDEAPSSFSSLVRQRMMARQSWPDHDNVGSLGWKGDNRVGQWRLDQGTEWRRPYRTFGRGTSDAGRWKGTMSRFCDSPACRGRGSDSESWRRPVTHDGCGCVRGYNSFASLDQRFIRRSWRWSQDQGVVIRPYSFGRGNDAGRLRGTFSRGYDTSSEPWRRLGCGAAIGCGFMDHGLSSPQLSPRLIPFPQSWPFGPVCEGGPTSFGNVNSTSSEGASTFSSIDWSFDRKSCDSSNGCPLSSFGRMSRPRGRYLDRSTSGGFDHKSPPNLVLKRKCKVRVGFKSFVLLEDKTLCKTILREIWRGRVRDLVLEKWECVWLASRIMKAESCSELFGYLGSISNDDYRLECSMRRNLWGCFIRIAKTWWSGKTMFMCIPTRVSGKIWSPLVQFLESPNGSGFVQNDVDGLASCQIGRGINVGIVRARKLSSRSKRTGKSFQIWIEKKKRMLCHEPCQKMVVYTEAKDNDKVSLATSLDNFHSLKMLGMNQAWKSLKWIGGVEVGLGREVNSFDMSNQLQLVVYKGPPLICKMLAFFAKIGEPRCANYIDYDSKHHKEKKNIDWGLSPIGASKIVKVRKKKKHKSRLGNVMKKIGGMMIFDRRGNGDCEGEMGCLNLSDKMDGLII